MTEPRRVGATRWRRALLVSLPALLVSLTLGWSIASGAVLTNIVAADSRMSISVAGLFGREAGLGVVDAIRRDCDANGANCVDRSERIVRAGFADARINQLCVAAPQKVKIGGVGVDYTVMLTAGDAGTDKLATWEITARNVVLDLPQIEASRFELDGQVYINTTAEDVTTSKDANGNSIDNPLGATESAHRFGLDASFAKVRDLKNAQAQLIDIENAFELKNLSIRVLSGVQTCPSQGAATSWPLAPVRAKAGTNLCFDVSGGGLVDGTDIVGYTCNGQTNQDFFVEDSTKISVLGTRCLTAASGTAGALVESVTCSAAADARQKWTYDADLTDTTLRNTASGLCVQGTGTSGGALTMQACNATLATQRYDLPR